MKRQQALWLARALWAATVACFVAGIWGEAPNLLKACAPLGAFYLLVVARYRRLPTEAR